MPVFSSFRQTFEIKHVINITWQLKSTSYEVQLSWKEKLSHEKKTAADKDEMEETGV